QFRPPRLDGDSHHLLIKPADLGFEGWHPCLTDLLARRFTVFGWHPLDGFERGAAAHEQYMRWKRVGIDGERHLGVSSQGPHLWRAGNCADHKLLAVPMEAERDRTRGTVDAGVGHPSGDVGPNQLLRKRIVQYVHHIIALHVYPPHAFAGWSPRTQQSCIAGQGRRPSWLLSAAESLLARCAVDQSSSSAARARAA